jgi:hypothetical protein
VTLGVVDELSVADIEGVDESVNVLDGVSATLSDGLRDVDAERVELAEGVRLDVVVDEMESEVVDDRV